MPFLLPLLEILIIRAMKGFYTSLARKPTGRLRRWDELPLIRGLPLIFNILPDCFDRSISYRGAEIPFTPEGLLLPELLLESGILAPDVLRAFCLQSPDDLRR